MAAHFWSKVDRQAPNGCWHWKLSMTGRPPGHGQYTYRFFDKQQHFYAHRVAWVLTHGPIQGDLCCLHRCDNTRCVNPNHLFLGTQADNLDDARVKGRLVDGRHKIKLSDEAVADIQATYRPRHNGKALAARYGVCLRTIVLVSQNRHRVQQPSQPLPADPQHVDGIFDGPDGPFQRVAFVQIPVLGEVS
jgi:hypothetical protein